MIVDQRKEETLLTSNERQLIIMILSHIKVWISCAEWRTFISSLHDKDEEKDQ
jgi:hypothetical protein